jgi:hypothetical protein
LQNTACVFVFCLGSLHVLHPDSPGWTEMGLRDLLGGFPGLAVSGAVATIIASTFAVRTSFGNGEAITVLLETATRDKY